MRHDETPERGTRAPIRRHHPDPTAGSPGTGVEGGRPGHTRHTAGTDGSDTERPPEQRSTGTPIQARNGRSRPVEPRNARFPSADDQGARPSPVAPRIPRQRPTDPRPVPPRQAAPPYPPAPEDAPQGPPMPTAPPGPFAPPGPEGEGHGRHAAPASKDPGKSPYGAGAPEHRPGHARPVRPDAVAGDEEIPDLLGAAEEELFRERWHEVQARFVDDPRQAVHAADVLVGDVMRTLADTFAQHRQALESQWSQGLEADTESLRRALCQYRALFHRLLPA